MKKTFLPINNQGEKPENDHYKYYPCGCACHKNSHIVHVVACCENGYIKVKKITKKDLESKE